jgi:transcription antitermination factor NusG
MTTKKAVRNRYRFFEHETVTENYSFRTARPSIRVSIIWSERGKRCGGMNTLPAGNIQQVRKALEGITGVDPVVRVEGGPDRYLVMVRMNRELDAVDSLRRHQFRAYWPSFEELMPTRKVYGGRTGRRLRRVGILPGYVFSAIDGRDFIALIDRLVGVIDVARSFSGEPLLIRDDDIRIIRRIEVGLNTPSATASGQHRFKVGERVRFVDDLIGRWPPGRIRKLAREGRIGVEVELMGRKLDIIVLPHQIERTQARPARDAGPQPKSFDAGRKNAGSKTAR